MEIISIFSDDRICLASLQLRPDHYMELSHELLIGTVTLFEPFDIFYDKQLDTRNNANTLT